MDERRGVVVNALALRIGGGSSGLVQILRHLPSHWSDVVVLVHPSMLERAEEACGGRAGVEVRTLGNSGRTARVLVEHAVLPVVHWLRGRRTWISLGNLPVLLWPGRQVVLVQSIYLINAHHDDMVRPATRLMVRLQRLLLRLLRRRLAGIVYISEVSARAADRRLCEVPHRVAHYGVEVDGDRCARDWRAGEEPLRLVMLSTLYRHKRIETVIDALRHVVAETDARLVVIGATDDGAYFDELRRRVDDVGLSASVSWAGPLPHDDLVDTLTSSHVYVLLSTVETFGMTWLEAQALGLPVVAPDVPLAREVLGDAAIFVDPDDSGGTAAAILRAARESGILRERARANVQAHAVPRTAAVFWSACDDLLDPAGVRPAG